MAYLTDCVISKQHLLDLRKFEDNLIIPLTELFPALNQFIKESGLENDIEINFPPCPYAELEEDNFYFFMENMKEDGYSEEVDKKLGIDAAHIKVVLDELAKFHATSHAYIMNKAKQTSLTQVFTIFLAFFEL